MGGQEEGEDERGHEGELGDAEGLDGAQVGGEVEAAQHVGDLAGAERGGVRDGDDGGVEHGEAEDAAYLLLSAFLIVTRLDCWILEGQCLYVSSYIPDKASKSPHTQAYAG